MGEILLALVLAFVAGAVVLLSIGNHVVKRYPDVDDARRNRKRYTVPAGIGALVALLAGIGAVGVGLTVIFQAVT